MRKNAHLILCSKWYVETNFWEDCRSTELEVVPTNMTLRSSWPASPLAVTCNRITKCPFQQMFAYKQMSLNGQNSESFIFKFGYERKHYDKTTCGSPGHPGAGFSTSDDLSC